MPKLFQEAAHAALSAVFPRLTLQRYASWRVGRRLTSGVLIGLMVLSTIPAKAQFADMLAWGQRQAEYLKNEYREYEAALRHLQTTAQTDIWWLRQMAASYSDYQAGVKLYQRVTNPSTSINLIQAMPMLEVYGQNGGSNVEDHYVLRPVYRPSQRLNHPHIPGVDFGGFDQIADGIRNGTLSIDLDHFTVVKPADDSTLSPEELRKRSVEDGWGNWQRAQEINEIEEPYQDIPFDASTYQGLTNDVRTHFAMRRADLQATAMFLSARGEDDPVYKQAIQALADLDAAINRGDADKAAQDVATRLLKIDGQAAEVVSIAARLRQAVGEVARRQSVKQENLQTLKKVYKPPQGNVFSFTEWFNKLGDDKEPNKEQLSAQMMANAHAEDASTTASEGVKHNLLNKLEEQNAKFRDLAAQKASALVSLKNSMGDAWYADQIKLLNLEVANDTAVNRMRIIMLRLPAQTSIPIVVADHLSQIPGTVAASTRRGPQPSAAAEIAQNLPGKLSQRLPSVTKSVAESKTLSLGPLQPLFAGLDAAGRSVFGRSFNLTSWRQ